MNPVAGRASKRLDFGDECGRARATLAGGDFQHVHCAIFASRCNVGQMTSFRETGTSQEYCAARPARTLTKDPGAGSAPGPLSVPPVHPWLGQMSMRRCRPPGMETRPATARECAA
jgi:hypothetical protein